MRARSASMSSTERSSPQRCSYFRRLLWPLRPRITARAEITSGKGHGAATPRRSTMPKATLSAAPSPRRAVQPTFLVATVHSRAP